MDATNQRYIKLGLIGHPVSHSISPLLHGAALSYAGIRGEYNLIDVPSEEELAERVRTLVSDGYVGWNVTVPHKQAMYRLMDELTEEAARAGAVNTVKVSDTAGGAKLVGHNTDLGGFKQDLQELVQPGGVAGRTTMILGAGGAARAAVCALVDLQAREVLIAARNFAQAQELADSIGAPNVRAIEADNAAGVAADIVINCTPIGLKVQKSPEWVTSLISTPSSAPEAKRFFYDMVYSRTAGDTTLLVREAWELGWLCRDGLGMLLNQAVLAFEFWTGAKIPVDEMLQRS